MQSFRPLAAGRTPVVVGFVSRVYLCPACGQVVRGHLKCPTLPVPLFKVFRFVLKILPCSMSFLAKNGEVGEREIIHASPAPLVSGKLRT